MGSTLDTVFPSGTILSCPECGEGLYKVTARSTTEDLVIDDGAGGKVSVTACLIGDVPTAWTYSYLSSISVNITTIRSISKGVRGSTSTSISYLDIF